MTFSFHSYARARAEGAVETRSQNGSQGSVIEELVGVTELSLGPNQKSTGWRN